MTAQEAIEILQEKISPCVVGEWKKSVDAAISALAKQIPKKVRITTSTRRCATCGRQLSGIGNIHPKRNYCQGCGQAIDWEEGDE